MKNTHRFPHFLAMFASLGLLFAPIGCNDKGDDDGSAEDDTTGDGDGDPTTGDGDPTTTGDGDPTTTGDGDPTTTGDGDPTTTGDGDPCDGIEPELPNGATCTSPCVCESGNCYTIPILGGQCSECDEDADCPDGGCTPPNPFESNGATCNMGEAGGGCESDEVCEAGLVCGTVLNLLSGLIQISTCGECNVDADCTGEQICAADVIVEDFSGIKTCMDEGALENNKYCELGEAGDKACANICSEVDIMGIATIGACGECKSDADCNGGTCQFGDFDIGSGQLFGSSCN